MSWAKKIGLRPEEEIIEIISRYPLSYFGRYVIGFLLLLADAFFMFFLLSQGYWGYATFILAAFLGLWIIFTAWLTARSNVLIITNERVVDIFRSSLFNEEVSSVGYGDLRDAYASRRGLLQHIFPYGTVSIEIKNSRAAIDVVKISHPTRVANLLTERRDVFRQGRRLGNKQAIYENFLSLIPRLSEEELCEVSDLVEERLQEFDSPKTTDSADEEEVI